jgi:hypothetical protein
MSGRKLSVYDEKRIFLEECRVKICVPRGGAIPSHPLDSNPLDVGFANPPTPPRLCLWYANSLTVRV